MIHTIFCFIHIKYGSDLVNIARVFAVPHCLSMPAFKTPATTGFESCMQINDEPESPLQVVENGELCGDPQTISG